MNVFLPCSIVRSRSTTSVSLDLMSINDVAGLWRVASPAVQSPVATNLSFPRGNATCSATWSASQWLAFVSVECVPVCGESWSCRTGSTCTLRPAPFRSSVPISRKFCLRYRSQCWMMCTRRLLSGSMIKVLLLLLFVVKIIVKLMPSLLQHNNKLAAQMLDKDTHNSGLWWRTDIGTTQLCYQCNYQHLPCFTKCPSLSNWLIWGWNLATFALIHLIVWNSLGNNLPGLVLNSARLCCLLKTRLFQLLSVHWGTVWKCAI